MPKKLECFDISHTFGEETVASCVSFSVEGPQKKDYRKFNIRNTSVGDDYAAMKEVLERHFFRIKKSEIPLKTIVQNARSRSNLPPLPSIEAITKTGRFI